MAARIALPGYAVPLNRTTSSGAQRRTAASRRMAASMKPGRPREEAGAHHACIMLPHLVGAWAHMPA
jgi:hypothetical protein